MVEFAAGALASLAGGIGSAATSVGSAVGIGSAGASLFSGATPSIFGSILQGTAGLVGAMGAMRQGQSQADSLNMQASQAQQDAAQQDIIAAQADTSLKQKLVATLGQRDIAYGASGVDLSFGTPQVARGQDIQNAGDAMSVTDDNAAMMKQSLLARSALYTKMAGDAQTAGDITGVGDILGAGAKILARG